MSSVTARVKEVSQPRGGYIKPSQFQVTRLDDQQTLGAENVHVSIVGTAVDYMTRYMLSQDVNEAFKISLMGYRNRIRLLGEQTVAQDVLNKVEISRLLKHIKELDDVSIIAACKACAYDVWYRNPMVAMTARSAADTNPDTSTIENIRIMVNRSLAFWEQYGPITSDGFTFEPYGYTNTVNTGDGDYLTADTLWDFKVSKATITNKHTLQLLMYWIMGQHSGQDIYKNITRLGIYNPRLNEVYLLEMSQVPESIIQEVESVVIRY